MSCTANLKELNSVIIYSFINLKTSITLFLDKSFFLGGGGGWVWIIPLMQQVKKENMHVLYVSN